MPKLATHTRRRRSFGPRRSHAGFPLSFDPHSSARLPHTCESAGGGFCIPRRSFGAGPPTRLRSRAYDGARACCLTVRDAARVAGISRSQLYELFAAGKLTPRRCAAGARWFSQMSLRRFCASCLPRRSDAASQIPPPETKTARCGLAPGGERVCEIAAGNRASGMPSAAWASPSGSLRRVQTRCANAPSPVAPSNHATGERLARMMRANGGRRLSP